MCGFMKVAVSFPLGQYQECQSIELVFLAGDGIVVLGLSDGQTP